MPKEFSIIFIFLIGLIGCKHESKPILAIDTTNKLVSHLPTVKLLRAIKCNPKDDSLYLYSNGDLVSIQRQDSRYFFISYETTKKADVDYHPIEGNLWFSCGGDFPTKNTIDSLVYRSLGNKTCYTHIIIKSIYEFQSEADFDAFDFKYKSDPIPKFKKRCN
jgi:hypothetical protein